MKKLLALLICLSLLCALALPVCAAEATDPTQSTGTVPLEGMAGADIMAIFCLVMVVGGGIYLLISFKRSGRNH